jgi:hypothetical protein
MDSIKEEARLYAIEYMIMNLAAKHYYATGRPLESVQELHAAQRRMLETQTFGLESPAEGDHFAAEVQACVENIQKGIEELVGGLPLNRQ